MKFKKEIIVGLISTIGLVTLIVGFFFLKGQNLWESKDHYYAVFTKAEGLVNGNSVLKNGVPIGVLTNVELYPNDPSKVLVRFDITTEWVKLPTGTTAELEPGLIGSSVINLIFSNNAQNFYSSGDTLDTDIKEGIQNQIDKRLAPLEFKVQELLGTADSAINIIAAIFNRNTGNLDESFDGIKRAILNFEQVSLHLDTLIAGFSGAREEIFISLTNIKSITGNLKESNAEITAILKNAETITDSLASLDLANTLGKADSALLRVNSILYELENGEGSLTMLLKDSTLYNNVSTMVEEAGRLVENIQEHPNRYLQFAVFGSKDKGVNLSSKDEKLLRNYVKDSLRVMYKGKQ